MKVTMPGVSIGKLTPTTATKPLQVYAAGYCVNCGRYIDSREKRSHNSVVYVIGSKLCCTKDCVKRAFGAEVAATV